MFVRFLSEWGSGTDARKKLFLHFITLTAVKAGCVLACVFLLTSEESPKPALNFWFWFSGDIKFGDFVRGRILIGHIEKYRVQHVETSLHLTHR